MLDFEVALRITRTHVRAHTHTHTHTHTRARALFGDPGDGEPHMVLPCAGAQVAIRTPARGTVAGRPSGPTGGHGPPAALGPEGFWSSWQRRPYSRPDAPAGSGGCATAAGSSPSPCTSGMPMPGHRVRWPGRCTSCSPTSTGCPALPGTDGREAQRPCQIGSEGGQGLPGPQPKGLRLIFRVQVPVDQFPVVRHAGHRQSGTSAFGIHTHRHTDTHTHTRTHSHALTHARAHTSARAHPHAHAVAT